MPSIFIQEVQQESSNRIFDISMLKTFYQLQLANNSRFKTSFSLVLVALHLPNEVDNEIEYTAASLHDLYTEISSFLQLQVRNSDIIFQVENENKWVILLTHSGQEEAKYFLKRVFGNFQEQYTEVLTAAVTEIGNNYTLYEEAIQESETCLLKIEGKEPFNIIYSDQFLQRETEMIRVSIIEPDEIVLNIIKNLLERTVIDYFDLEIKTFSDGHAFLSSDWHTSGHTHLVVMNDVLPKKNGIDVLHRLQKMPNHQKYITFMMSKRNTEEDMVYVYEHGVDEYITKPFNIKLFEARIKKSLKRLRL